MQLYFTYGGPDAAATNGESSKKQRTSYIAPNASAAQPEPVPPITAKPSKLRDRPATVGVRQDLRTFFYPPSDLADRTAALQRRDLFILAFARWQSLPKEDPDSYIQLAGVHGRPMSVGYGFDAPPTETEKDGSFDPLIKLKYVDRSGPGDNSVQFSNMGVAEFAYCKHGRPTFMVRDRPPTAAAQARSRCPQH